MTEQHYTIPETAVDPQLIEDIDSILAEDRAERGEIAPFADIKKIEEEIDDVLRENATEEVFAS